MSNGVEESSGEVSGLEEETLDPSTEAEWEAIRQAGYRVVDQLVARHRNLREQPCWQPPDPQARASYAEPAPEAGLGIHQVMAQAERFILPYGTGNLHPRFWGWVIGAGTLPGILGQFLATSMNANVFGADQGPVHLERQVLEWFKTWFGFPKGSSGLLTDGASMANLLGVAVARHAATSGKSKVEGPSTCAGLRVYASEVTHNSIIKAAQFLGLGSNGVHLVPSVQGRMDLSALAAAVEADRRAGVKPFCLVANVGTVGIGAIDPLEEMRAFADRERLWLHADGAIGALAWLSPMLRSRLAGLTQADSLAFDLHKWGQVPYDAGCLLVRDGELHTDAFRFGAEYLNTVEGGMNHHGSHAFNAYTPLLSRADRALKVWTMVKALGTRRLAKVFEKNAAQAEFLGRLVDKSASLERLAPVSLNIVCFRFNDGRDEAALNKLNERILIELQESGFCVLSPFKLNGRFCLRVAISNHRTLRQDVEALVERVLRLGKRGQG